MSLGDKVGMVELETSLSRVEQIPHAEEAKPNIGKWHRGDLNGAYQKWRDGGSPADPTHPLLNELMFETRLFVSRMMSKAERSSRELNDERLARIENANQRDIQQAMMLHDPNRNGAAFFTTYVKRAVLNNIRDELRRVLTTHQAELLRAHEGDLEAARGWIDLTRTTWKPTKNGLQRVTRAINIEFKDRRVAHWLLRQDPTVKITWRHVVNQFPDYTEDTAGRVLRRVKKAIEKAGFYRIKSKRTDREDGA